MTSMDAKKEDDSKPCHHMDQTWNNKEKTPRYEERIREVANVPNPGLPRKDDLNFIIENLCKSTTERQLLESVILDPNVPFSPL